MDFLSPVHWAPEIQIQNLWARKDQIKDAPEAP